MSEKKKWWQAFLDDRFEVVCFEGTDEPAVIRASPDAMQRLFNVAWQRHAVKTNDMAIYEVVWEWGGCYFSGLRAIGVGNGNFAYEEFDRTRRDFTRVSPAVEPVWLTKWEMMKSPRKV